LRISIEDETERALVTALRERPEDLQASSVYADWLDGAGVLDRAAYLRAQVAAANAVSPTEPTFLAAASNGQCVAIDLVNTRRHTPVPDEQRIVIGSIVRR